MTAPKTLPPNEVVENLKFLCRTCDGLSKFITATKLRLHGMGDHPEKLDTVLYGYETTGKKFQGATHIKSKILRDIEKELEFFPIWTE